MKNVLKAAVCAALLASVSAHAETFDFSYTFDDGPSLTGSLSGTLVGDTVEGISDVHVALNGIAFTGPLNVAGLDSDTFQFTSPATVSTDVSKNNFIFTDAADVNSAGWTNFFEMTGPTGVFATNAKVTDGVNSGSDLSANASWSLAPVPLPAGFLLFSSGLGLFGAVSRRRQSA